MSGSISAREIQAAGGLGPWMQREALRAFLDAARGGQIGRESDGKRKDDRRHDNEVKRAPKGREKTGKPPRIPEHDEQCALIRRCRDFEAVLPELRMLIAVPNGGQRHAAVAKKLAAEGVKAGFPDLFLFVPRGECHGLAIELKAHGGRASDLQREWIAALESQGYRARVCVGAEAAWSEIVNYLENNHQPEDQT